jgi:hypothetical protein
MATPRQWRRRRRFSLFALTVAAALVVAAVAFGAVQTDQYYYNVGDTVQITGDNMAADENVTVDVTYPDATLAQEHVVAADGNGNFSDSYTIQSTDPAGVYTVTATGQESANVFTTTFDPAADATAISLTITPGHSTGNSGEVYYGDTLAFTGTVTDTTDSGTTVSAGNAAVQQSKGKKTGCTTPDFAGTTDIYTHAVTSSGGFDSGAMTPGLATFPANSGFSSGNYWVANFAGPPVSLYADAIGSYGFQSVYKGYSSSTLHFAASDPSDCKTVSVVKAPTTTTSQPADNSGTPLTQIGTGVQFYVEWGVGSDYGVDGNNASGSVALSQTDTGGIATTGLCDGAGTKSFSETEHTIAPNKGFNHPANSTQNSGDRFTCTPTTVGTYKVYVSFTDNAENAATNPDGNYQDSDSSPGSQIDVTSGTIQVCKAAPAIAADYMHDNHVKINVKNQDNIVQLIANEMAKLTRAQFPTYTYTKGTMVNPTAGALLLPCSDATTYKSSVEAKTQYYIDTLR